MRRALILTAALLLAGCSNSPEEREARAEEVASRDSTPKVVNLDGIGQRICIDRYQANISLGSEVGGDYRRRFLTPQADKAGVRVFIGSSTVSDYGSTVIHYSNKANTCLLWSESLTLQELAVRLGMSPEGISPYYEVTGGNSGTN